MVRFLHSETEILPGVKSQKYNLSCTYFSRPRRSDQKFDNEQYIRTIVDGDKFGRAWTFWGLRGQAFRF